jgi:hypothetical protein
MLNILAHKFRDLSNLKQLGIESGLTNAMRPGDYEALRAKTQQTLIDFLDVELKLGRTFVQSAGLSKDEGHGDHFVQAKHYATRAAESVRKFIEQVVDNKIRDEFRERLTELEGLISTLRDKA